VAGISPVLRMENCGDEGALKVELEDEAGAPGLRLSAKHGFVEAVGLKTIGLDFAWLLTPLEFGDALVNAILALPRER
jgi:hypothetical protein